MKRMLALSLFLILLAACCVPAAAESVVLWTCPSCGNTSSGNYCSRCGMKRPEELRWVCPVCGAECDDNFCPNCGAAKSAVPEAGPEETAEQPDGNALSSYGYVTADSVNFRKEPGRQSARIARLKKFALCEIIGTETLDGVVWYNVTYGGTAGYIDGDYFRQMTVREAESFLDSTAYWIGLSNNAEVLTELTAEQTAEPAGTPAPEPTAEPAASLPPAGEIEGVWNLTDVTGVSAEEREIMTAELSAGGYAQYVFRDGRFSMTVCLSDLQQEMTGTYETKDGKLTVTIDGESSVPVEYKTDGNTLEILASEDLWMIFTRQEE